VVTASDQARVRGLFRRWYDAYNARDINQLDALWDETYAPHLIVHDPTMPEIAHDTEGPAHAVKKLVRQILHDYVDIQAALDDMFGEGDKIATRDHFAGTRVSDGRQAKAQSISISRLANSRVVEVWQLTRFSIDGGPGNKQP
jgi:predicted ester cyclase